MPITLEAWTSQPHRSIMRPYKDQRHTLLHPKRSYPLTRCIYHPSQGCQLSPTKKKQTIETTVKGWKAWLSLKKKRCFFLPASGFPNPSQLSKALKHELRPPVFFCLAGRHPELSTLRPFSIHRKGVLVLVLKNETTLLMGFLNS